MTTGELGDLNKSESLSSLSGNGSLVGKRKITNISGCNLRCLAIERFSALTLEFVGSVVVKRCGGKG